MVRTRDNKHISCQFATDSADLTRSKLFVSFNSIVEVVVVPRCVIEICGLYRMLYLGLKEPSRRLQFGGEAYPFTPSLVHKNPARLKDFDLRHYQIRPTAKGMNTRNLLTVFSFRNRVWNGHGFLLRHHLLQCHRGVCVLLSVCIVHFCPAMDSMRSRVE